MSTDFFMNISGCNNCSFITKSMWICWR